MWNPEDAEEEVLVMVCRTGLHTTMGGIIQQLLTPTRLYKEKDPFLLVGCCHSFLSAVWVSAMHVIYACQRETQLDSYLVACLGDYK